MTFIEYIETNSIFFLSIGIAAALGLSLTIYGIRGIVGVSDDTSPKDCRLRCPKCGGDEFYEDSYTLVVCAECHALLNNTPFGTEFYEYIKEHRKP